jgi:hypothetical protein
MLENQLVLTPIGWKPIESVQRGDRVITGIGEASRVTDVWRRECLTRLTEIKVEGWSQLLRTTSDHRYLLENGDWGEAGLLRPGDRLGMPRVSSELGLSSVLFDDDCRVSDRFVGPGGLQRNGRLVHAPARVSLTEEALFVFGYFAGDGFSSISPGKGRFVSFAGHKIKKAESILRCQQWAESLGLGFHLCKSRDMGMELRAYSAEWAFWFRKHFGHGANNKRLPEFLLNLSRPQSEALLSGLIASDGYCRKGRREYITGSNQLAAQVARLIIRCGYRPCVGKNSTGQFSIAFSENGTAGLVREVKHRFPRKLNGKREQIYNLSVEDHSSFAIGLSVVHDCP